MHQATSASGGGHGLPPTRTTPAVPRMSVRKWAPSRWILPSRVYAASRAAASVSPIATTSTTRPPADTTAPSSRRRVPACSTPGRSAPVSTSPPRGLVRVAERGQHDGHRVPVPPAQRRVVGQRPGRGRPQQPGQRRLQQREHDLGLRVAEAGVELDHPRPPRGQRQPDVEQPGERRAPRGQLGQRRPDHGRQHVVDQPGRRPVQRRVRPHAAGVGAGVAVADPLEVLRRQQRPHRRPVGQAEQRDLRAVQELLDHHGPAGLGVRQRGRPVGGHHHALAGGQPVVLHHVRRAELVQRRRGLRRRRAGPGRARSAPRPRPSRPWRTPSSPRCGPPRRSARSRRSRPHAPRRPPRRPAAPRDRSPPGRPGPRRPARPPRPGRRRPAAAARRPSRCRRCRARRPARSPPGRPRAPGTARAPGHRCRRPEPARARGYRPRTRTDGRLPAGTARPSGVD